MRVLFFMSHPGATRNFESTIRGLAEDGHEVHLAFDRTAKKNLPGVWEPAATLVAQYPAVTWSEHPKPLKSDPAGFGSRLRASLDYTRYLEPEFAGAPKLRARAESWTSVTVRDRYAGASRTGRQLMRTSLRIAERSVTPSPVIGQYIDQHKPDVVLVTPLLEPGTIQTEYVREANRRGIPTCLLVHSWDNLTNKGLIHEPLDVVAVWNEMQRDEAVKLHNVPEERIVITGATPYDQWFGWKPSRSREEFSARVGLDPSRPFVLYVGSSGFIAPDEAAFIVEWDREIRQRGLDDVQVLVRAHPVNPLKGPTPSQAELGRLERVFLYPPDATNPTDQESRNDYFDSLHYCSAVVGVNTSAFLEAAVHRRPVLSVRTPRYASSMDGTLHFEYLLSAGGGLVEVADSYDQHAARLAEALDAPHPEGAISERSTRFVEAFIRPHGLNEAATPRMIEMIESLPEQPKTARASRGTPIIGPMLVTVMRKRHAKMLDRVRSDKAERVRVAEERRATKAERKAGREAKAARRADREAKAARKAARTENADTANQPKSNKSEKSENTGGAGVADRPEGTHAERTHQNGVTSGTEVTRPEDTAPPASPSSQVS